ncbi:MAG: UDP-N-acetylmuramoyl-L-alanine--D-glutamate ligase [Oscillospiraceae bacterium]|nr:UDP-N-acetylmuramoyl-L-alanine--D-glutamate ligase [Oscillospiraceae bacterium]
MTYDEYFDALRAKRVGVVGYGVSNAPLVRELASRGIDVTVCDRRTAEQMGEECARLAEMGCKLKLGEDYLQNLDFDVIFRTPGLHPRYLADAAARGAVITSEMEAFFALCPCKTIAVTGSDGKTTTATLIAEFLKAENYTVHLGGNIGQPLLTSVPLMTKYDYAVLELSSFQLHSMICCPDVAVVTNVSPNHLDVHPSYDDYIDAKRSIFKNQRPDCLLVLNRDNDITRSFAKEAPGRVKFFSRHEMLPDGLSLVDGTVYRSGKRVMDASALRVPGVHNVENAMAAMAATEGFVSDQSCVYAIGMFYGVPHRIELVRKLRGVKFYNDSIASSPTRTIAGLRSFDDKVILIAGGHDKHVPFDGLAEEITKRVKRLYLTGESAQTILKAVQAAPDYDPEALPVEVIDDFETAVRTAAKNAVSGDSVILSPACSSFDRFKNFEERGETFKKIIVSLM